MALLDLGAGPRKGEMYRMPPRLYDDTDLEWHPILLVRVDPMWKMTTVATRTTKEYARTSLSVTHGADQALQLNELGWW